MMRLHIVRCTSRQNDSKCFPRLGNHLSCRWVLTFDNLKRSCTLKSVQTRQVNNFVTFIWNPIDTARSTYACVNQGENYLQADAVSSTYTGVHQVSIRKGIDTLHDPLGLSEGPQQGQFVSASVRSTCMHQLPLCRSLSLRWLHRLVYELLQDRARNHETSPDLN